MAEDSPDYPDFFPPRMRTNEMTRSWVDLCPGTKNKSGFGSQVIVVEAQNLEYLTTEYPKCAYLCQSAPLCI